MERQLGVTYKTAWRMGHEIRKHMAEVDGDGFLEGDVEADEMLVGGYKKGMRGSAGKTVIMGMLERGGEIILKAVPNVEGRDATGSSETPRDRRLNSPHRRIPPYMALREHYDHQTVHHKSGQWVDGNCHVNGLESFWKHFKASVKGTHIHISAKHREKYAKEFEFRFNHRDNPRAMFPALVSSFLGLRPAPSTPAGS